MTAITISSADAERIARQFSALISAKGLQRIRRVAINQIGAGLRRNTKAIAPPIYGTTAAALMVQGTAAKPGSDDPRYVLRMARSISIGRLRAANRKTRRQWRQVVADRQHPGNLADPLSRDRARRPGVQAIEGRAAPRAFRRRSRHGRADGVWTRGRRRTGGT